MGKIAAAIPDELAALRPEDIRVEAQPEPEASSVEALQVAQTAQAVQLPRRVETPPRAPVRPDPPPSAAVLHAQPTTLIDSSLPTIQVDPPSMLMVVL